MTLYNSYMRNLRFVCSTSYKQSWPNSFRSFIYLFRCIRSSSWPDILPMTKKWYLPSAFFHLLTGVKHWMRTSGVIIVCRTKIGYCSDTRLKKSKYPSILFWRGGEYSNFHRMNPKKKMCWRWTVSKAIVFTL